MESIWHIGFAVPELEGGKKELIAGSGLCKYGLQRYLPPAKADPPA